MRKTCILLILLISTLTNFAQQTEQMSKPQRSPEEIAQRQTLMLQKDLSLTEEQVTKVYEINLKYAQLGRPTDQQQAESRKKQKLSDLKVVLTEAQYEKFEAKMSEFRHLRPGMKFNTFRDSSATHLQDAYHN